MLHNPFFWLWLLVSFLLGLNIGKNNASKVQKIGEVAEEKIGEASEAVVKDINHQNP